MPGRVGASIAPDAFAAPQAEIGLALFAKVPSDGGWHPIAEMPGRPCAFEITAATTREVVSAKPTFMSALRWLAGMRKAQNGVLHTVVTATGGNHKPRLQVSADPEVAAAMHRLRLVLLVFLVVLLGLFLQIDLQSRVSPDTSAGYVVAESIQGMRDFATWSGMVNVYVLATKAWAIRVNALPGVLVYPLYTAALAGLLFGLRCAVAVWSEGHQSLRLKWVPAGGSMLQGNRKWTLCLSGPIFEKRGAADEHDICFHITKLWS